MRKVVVEWVDAVSHDNTVHIDEVEDLLPIQARTIGHLVRDERDFIIVARDLFGESDDHPSGLIVIPRGCIRDIVDLDSGESIIYSSATAYINASDCAPPGSLHIMQDEDGG